MACQASPSSCFLLVGTVVYSCGYIVMRIVDDIMRIRLLAVVVAVMMIVLLF